MPDSFGAILGRRMAERRAELRLTQGQLAALVWPGDSNAETTRKGDISKLESGKVPNPQATTVQRIAKALEIEAEIDALRQRAQLTPAQQLEVIPTLSRDQLELLASRFGILAPHDRTDGDLRGLLTDKATEYRALKAQIDALLAKFPQLGNVVAEARARLDDGDTEGVRQMVRDARQVLHDAHLREGLEQDAELVELDAAALLLDNRVDEAFAQLSAAADSFASIDPLEPAQRRLAYADRLYQHGLRYGGPGLALAARMLREALARIDRATQPRLWASAMHDLANSIRIRGTRTAGIEGLELLSSASTAYRAALKESPKTTHAVNWATINNDLGVALRNQGMRCLGSKGTALLNEAINAYHAALDVFTQQEHPLVWSSAQNNLGNALLDLGGRAETPGATLLLLQEANSAYLSALKVRNKGAFPVEWATTQHNLAASLMIQGASTAGPRGAALLELADAAYSSALEVRSPQAHPVDWAMTQENLAILHEAIARHDTCTDPVPPLRVALQHVDAALTIYDPVHLPRNYQQTTALRERILAALSVAGG